MQKWTIFIFNLNIAYGRGITNAEFVLKRLFTYLEAKYKPEFLILHFQDPLHQLGTTAFLQQHMPEAKV